MTYRISGCDASGFGVTVLAKWIRHRALLLAALLGLLVSNGVAAAGGETKHGSLAELGAKLSNPLSDVWALFLEVDVNWRDGNITDDHKIGSDAIFSRSCRSN